MTLINDLLFPGVLCFVSSKLWEKTLINQVTDKQTKNIYFQSTLSIRMGVSHHELILVNTKYC